MTGHHDSDLRRLLDDAVSGVHPDDALDGIRARTARPSSIRWVPLTVAAAAATAVVIGGAAWFAEQQPSDDTPSAGAPSTSSATSAPASPAPAPRTVTVPVYYVGDTASGPRLFTEQHRVEGATGTDLQVAVDEVTSNRAQDKDYSGWPTDGTTAKATLGSDLITIDLSGTDGSTADVADGAGEKYLQALVWTADAATRTALPVRFLVDGQPTDSVLGSDTSTPVQRLGEDSTLSPVLVESPVEGATVPTTFTVTGRAATFEANVVWELKRGSVTVRHGFTTAAECCTLSPYSFTLTAPPGHYTLVVHDTDESGGEGVGTTQDTKEITVR